LILPPHDTAATSTYTLSLHDALPIWDIADSNRPVGQQRGGQNRQRGVLRAGNADFSFQPRAALDQQFVHVANLLNLYGPCVSRSPSARRIHPASTPAG